MLKRISTALTIIVFSASVTVLAAQTSGSTAQDRDAQEQTERERKAAEKAAEKAAKNKDKANKKEPGSRCARWKSGKA